MRLLTSLCLGSIASLSISSPAFAWGYEGHETVAAIARNYLTPTVRARVDAILSTDTDTLTKPDMISRSTWADVWRSKSHSETADWHFVDNEIIPTFRAPASITPNPTHQRAQVRRKTVWSTRYRNSRQSSRRPPLPMMNA